MIGSTSGAVAFAARHCRCSPRFAFGLAPALRLTRPRSAGSLLPGGRTFARGQERLRGALVVAEIALALVLLTGAGLMMQSFLRLRAVDPGFRPDNVLRCRWSCRSRDIAPPQTLHAFHQGTLEKLPRCRSGRSPAP